MSLFKLFLLPFRLRGQHVLGRVIMHLQKCVVTRWVIRGENKDQRSDKRWGFFFRYYSTYTCSIKEVSKHPPVLMKYVNGSSYIRINKYLMLYARK